jgi:hypothetical protein
MMYKLRPDLWIARIVVIAEPQMADAGNDDLTDSGWSAKRVPWLMQGMGSEDA